MLAVIGGSGFENFDGFEVIEYLDEKTPFGQTSTGLKRVKVNGIECLFLSRHGANHELLPSEVNYRANIFALKRAGARSLLSFSAVGSLKQEFKPGDLVIPSQYIDRTKGLRKNSFFGEGMVGHVSLANPTCTHSTKKLLPFLETLDGFDSFHGQTYVCIEGPYFSTRAESHWYRQMGGDIIGMTHYPEFALAREAGLNYLPCCFITDYDCWDESRPHVTVDEVITIMKKNNEKGFKVLSHIVAHQEKLFSESMDSEGGLKSGLMTPENLLTQEQKKIIETLIK